MTKLHATRKVHTPTDSEQGVGLVRTTKVIPSMNRLVVVQEPPPAPKVMQCMGRCGHCDVHPCQLHATV